MDSRNRTRSLSYAGRFCRKNAQNVSFECRKCAKQRQLRALRDRIRSRVAAAPAWAAWRVSLRCGWAARRTAVLRISGCYRQTPGRSSLGTGFGRSVQSRSTWFAAWAWWAGICVCIHCVRVQPGSVRARPCSIARFGVSCWERRDRIAAMQWVVNSGQLPAAGSQWPVAGSQLPVARNRWGRWELVEPGIGWRRAGDAQERWHYLPVADTPVGDEHARWHSFRGALRGESPRTREGRNGPTVPMD